MRRARPDEVALVQRHVHAAEIGADDPEEREQHAEQEGDGDEEREPAGGRPLLDQDADELDHAHDEAERLAKSQSEPQNGSRKTVGLTKPAFAELNQELNLM